MGFAKYAEDNFEIWTERVDKSCWNSQYSNHCCSVGNGIYNTEPKNNRIMDVYERKYDTLSFDLRVRY